MDRKTLASAKKLGKTMVKKKDRGLAVGGITRDNVSIKYYNIGCYGILKRKFDTGTKAIVSPLSIKCKPTDQCALIFYKWLLKDSYYAKVFMNKSVKSIWKHGFICRTDVPANLMVGALMLSRFPWEADKRYRDLFLKLYKEHHLTVLEIILFLQQIGFVNKSKTKFNIVGSYISAVFTHAYQTKIWFKNFLVGKPTHLRVNFTIDPYYTNGTDIYKMFDKHGGYHNGKQHQLNLTEAFCKDLADTKLITTERIKNEWGDFYNYTYVTDMDATVKIFKQLLKKLDLV